MEKITSLDLYHSLFCLKQDMRTDDGDIIAHDTKCYINEAYYNVKSKTLRYKIEIADTETVTKKTVTIPVQNKTNISSNYEYEYIPEFFSRIRKDDNALVKVKLDISHAEIVMMHGREILKRYIILFLVSIYVFLMTLLFNRYIPEIITTLTRCITEVISAVALAVIIMYTAHMINNANQKKQSEKELKLMLQ